MRHLIFKGLIFVLVLLAAGGRQEAIGYEINKKAVVLLAVKDPEGKVFSTGSGFIVDPSGVLITNYHVLVDAVEVDAVFQDGTKTPVKGILKIDRIKDFAVLKLKDGAYSTLELGNSSQLRESDYTSALGYLTEDAQMDQSVKPGNILQTYGFVLGVHP